FYCSLKCSISSYISDSRSTGSVPVRHVLPPKPGYIPVYIQHGDSPPDVASLYKASMPLHHKNPSKRPQKYKNNIYQSGHYMSLNRPKVKPQSSHVKSHGVLHHRVAGSKPDVDRPYYKEKTHLSRVRRFLDFLNDALYT
ncbi:hypothetical protein WDU94_004166, partial [Cyamophila willieti]